MEGERLDGRQLSPEAAVVPSGERSATGPGRAAAPTPVPGRLFGRRLLAAVPDPDPTARPATPTIRRLMATEALDALRGESTARGGSSFAKLRDEVKAFHALPVRELHADRAGKVKADKRLEKLAKISELAAAYVHGHMFSQKQVDKDRVALVRDLIEEVDEEMAELANAHHDTMYELGVNLARDKDSTYGFRQTGAASGGIGDGTRARAAAAGISPAEAAAIRLYGDMDFATMNPVVANIDGYGLPAEDTQTPEENAQIRDESGVHAGMLAKGLRKMPPYQGKEVYRGLGLTEEAYQRDCAGGIYQLRTYGSTSKSSIQAMSFAKRNLAGGRDVGVFIVFRGFDGRDISQLASQRQEQEVLLFPGAYAVTKRVELPYEAGQELYGADVPAPNGGLYQWRRFVLLEVRGAGTPKPRR